MAIKSKTACGLNEAHHIRHVINWHYIDNGYSVPPTEIKAIGNGMYKVSVNDTENLFEED